MLIEIGTKELIVIIAILIILLLLLLKSYYSGKENALKGVVTKIEEAKKGENEAN